MRQVTSEGKILICNTLAISKIALPSLLRDMPLMPQKEEVCRNRTFKLKHAALYKNYEKGKLKNVDILLRVLSVQCPWIKRLCESNFQYWKVIT